MKILRLIARIWSAPLILYALMMLVGYAWNWITIGTPDPYTVEGTPFVEALPPILLFLSTLGLALAWRWEKAGSLLSLGFLAATLAVLFFQVPLSGLTPRMATPYLMCLVVLIPGILFLASGVYEKPEE
jgi:hypothetical protein